MLELKTQQLSRELPQLMQYPHCSVGILDPHGPNSVAARNEALSHAHLLFAEEHNALNGDLDILDVLNDLCWKDNAMVRLL